MTKHSYTERFTLFKRGVGPILSWVVAGSLVGVFEGIWKVSEWGIPDSGNFRFWMEFNLERLLFIISALFVYGVLFGLFGVVSLVVTRALLPLISAADRHSVHIPLGLSLLLLPENIIVIFPYSSMERMLWMGVAALFLFVAVRGNILIREGRKDVFMRWMKGIAAGLMFLFIAIRISRKEIHWIVTQRKVKTALVGLAVAGILAWLYPRLKSFWKSRLYFVVRRWVLVAFVAGAVFFWTPFDSLFFFNYFSPDFSSRTLPKPDRPNIILIVVDALRADHLGLYGYRRRTSPHLDKWAEDSLVFDRAVSSSSWTLPSIVSLLTGRHPLRHGMLDNDDVMETSLPVLPKILSDDGYISAGFISNTAITFRSDFPGLFDFFYGNFSKRVLKKIVVQTMAMTKHVLKLVKYIYPGTFRETVDYIQIDDLNRAVFKWLSLQDGRSPFFLYLHYIDPHAEYRTHEEEMKNILSKDDPFNDSFKKAVSSKEPGDIDRYDCEVRFTDHHLNRLFLKLQQMGVWDNSLVILTADHGEAFNEHGNKHHGTSLYKEEVHVPLIAFSTKRFPFAGRFSPFVSLTDLTPTILDLLGVESGIDFDGKVLSPWMRDPGLHLERDVYSYLYDSKSIVQAVYSQNRWKQVTTRMPPDYREETKELYDMEVDPAEKFNLAQDRPQILKMMAEKLSRHDKVMAGKKVIARKSPFKATLKRALQSLGYIN